ncbi:hypothetical protein ACOME3_010378 [Neoechinorhynchus agilis]
MYTNVQSLAKGGKRSHNSLRIPLSSAVREPLLSGSGSSSISTAEEYLVLPIKRWPGILTITSNPIMRKDAIISQSLTPCIRSFHNEGIKHVDGVTYFGGTLIIYLRDQKWLHKLELFAVSLVQRNLSNI